MFRLANISRLRKNIHLHIKHFFTVQHRQREKEYRQKLSELRKKEKTKIDNEESLWKRLDELELQEELQEELDR
jgi:hypothetical protein